MKKIVGIMILILLHGWLAAQLFQQTTINLTGVWQSDGAWGDIDHDNDLDLLSTGYGLGTPTGGGLAFLYRNDGNGVFTEMPNVLTGVGVSSVNLVDYDGDFDLDLFLCGQFIFGADTTKLYRNEGNFTFVDTGIHFPGIASGCSTWGDYDGDGDLDLLLSGALSTSQNFTNLYRNDGNDVFTNVGAALPGIDHGQTSFGDYDNDGDLDIGLAGDSGGGVYITKIFRNDGNNVFTDLNVNVVGLRYSKCTWADYNADGLMDFLVSGSFVNEEVSYLKVLKNMGNDTFTDQMLPIMGVRQGEMALGDVNNDGYLDIIVNGLYENGNNIGKVYVYDPTLSVYNLLEDFTWLYYTSLLLGDYDNDHDLDFNMSGKFAYQVYYNQIWQNTCTTPNTPPTVPGSPNVSVNGNAATLSWTPATDSATPTNGLTYNLWVSTSPLQENVVPAMSDLTTGYRMTPTMGNMGSRTQFTLHDLADGLYFWRVQAVDNSFEGSPFTEVQSFIIGGQNTAPVISSFVPATTDFHASLESTVHFSVTASDFENDPLTYTWRLVNAQDSTEISGTSNQVDLEMQHIGFNHVKVIVSDGIHETVQAWLVFVDNLANEDPVASTGIGLMQNYPNPFTPNTTIAYRVKGAGEAELVIYNLKGQRIRTIVHGPVQAGTHHVMWDGNDDLGKRVGSGVYLYQLKTADRILQRKMVMLQ